MLNPDDFKKALQTIDALGATPAVLVKVIKLANDPNTDIETISDLLRNDGPLAANIIRISNSPYYAPETPHSNLNSSINQLGLSEVIRVVNLSLARQLFARDLMSYGVTAYDYWSTSVATALVMEALAKETGQPREDAYTLGILHAIGRVLINDVIDQKGFSIYWDNQQPIEEWERGAVGFDFAEAGSMLLEHWLFPSPICEIIRHQLVQEPAANAGSLLGTLQFTRRLLAQTGLDFAKPEWQIDPNDPFLVATGITPESISEMVTDCRKDFLDLLQTIDLK